VIIVHNENHPWSIWKLGRVTDIIKGDDGQVRGAVIDIVTNGKPQTLRRPITHLKLHQRPRIVQDDSAQNVTVDISTSRSVRAAAQRARQQVLQWISDETDLV